MGRLSILAAASGASGRLTLLQALVAVASRERTAVYLDLVGSLDPGFLADLGADLSALLVLRPPSGRWGEGFSMARSLVAAGAPWLAIALNSRSNAGWEHRLATLVESVAARRAVCLVSAASPLPLALGYASSLTLECVADGWEEAHGDVLGLRTHLTVVKSKVSTPGETAALLLRYPRPFAAAEAVGRPVVQRRRVPGDYRSGCVFRHFLHVARNWLGHDGSPSLNSEITADAPRDTASPRSTRTASLPF